MDTLVQHAIGSPQYINWSRAAANDGCCASMIPSPSRHRVEASVSDLLTPSPDERSRLIAAVAQRRDRACFAALYAYFAPRVKGYLLRLGMPSQLAEELAQETLLTVWRKAELFDPAKATAATWVFTIARNLRIDLARRSRDTPSDDLAQTQTLPSPADDYFAAQRQRRLGEALKTLPEDQAEVLRLSFFDDKPHQEIAARLGIPLGTVKSRVRLAMNRLRAELGDLK